MPIPSTRLLLVPLTVAAFAAVATAPLEPPPGPFDYETKEIAPNVYGFFEKRLNPIVSSNIIAVIGNDAVLLFDTGHHPTITRQIIGDVKRLTSKPVGYVVVSHWHDDHWAGNGDVAAGFPGVKVIAHEFTATMLDARSKDFRGEACRKDVQGQLPSLKERLANGKLPDQIPLIDDTRFPNIGDRMTEAGISWAWYAGKWNAVNADPARAPLFQYHHQPFNYFANYAEGAPGRSHLLDENLFVKAAQKGVLPRVSFVKPYALENEHPGYASEPDGSDHLVTLLRAINEGPQADSTLVVVTYDEFGGQWDHVSPPGQGGKRGPHDVFGPSTRIPALVISPRLRDDFVVDHTQYDTTSILATIERRFHLAPLSSRDAAVHDLSRVFHAK